METRTAIKTRRAVRGWTDRVVSDDQLHAILEAGRFAPSPLNSQPWSFIVIRDKATLNRLMPTAHHAPFITTANVLIVVTVSKEAEVDAWLSQHKQHIYSGVCALQNMWLATWDMGLGGCWIALDEKTTRECLEIPDTEELLGSLGIGYAAETPQPHLEEDRKPLKDIVFHEKFGER